MCPFSIENFRDICKKIMIERTMQSDSSNSLGGGVQFGGIGKMNGGAIRPTNLPTENRRWIRHRKLHIVSPHLPSVAHCPSKIVAQSFPTPMEEPKKMLRAYYVGAAEVQQATGMDVLNAAIDHLSESVAQEQFEAVNVSVAPSMISISNVSISSFIK